LIKQNFKRNFDDLIDFLTSSAGTYQRLEITAQPDVYRMAAFYSPINPETGPFLRWGKFDLVFDCMPQKFLKVGENKIDYSDAIVTSLMNPTLKPSRPLLIVEPTASNGTITINEQVITNTANSYRFYIDCELMHAYRLNSSNAVVSMDAYVTMPDDFVQLMPGENRISTNDAAMAIVPRWWRL
jgi:phage-related protein